LAESDAKAELALAAAERAGGETLIARTPATVRWLLCGRGRPVDAASPQAAYTVVLSASRRLVLFADIETSRVTAEERLHELGYEPVAYPWHAGPGLAELVEGTAVTDAEAEQFLAPHRRTLREEERERYGAGGRAVATAMTETVDRLAPGLSELDAAAELAARARVRGFIPPVVLVAGEARQPLHRHPLPTAAPLGRHALLAITAEREGLHISLTRLVSFGAPPAELERLTRLAAEVDAAMLAATRPGARLGEVLGTAARAYADRGFPEEWRRHHQGGLTGYRGREVFAVPDERTQVPESCAVAWNPSIAGGAKSEDTALITAAGFEIVTETPTLPRVDVDGVSRPAIAVR
jgi:Xaa-Pro aminopeptidase